MSKRENKEKGMKMGEKKRLWHEQRGLSVRELERRRQEQSEERKKIEIQQVRDESDAVFIKMT